MAQLTKEYFDKVLDKKLNEQTKELKAHAKGLQEELARMVADGFLDVQKRLDVRERLASVERKIAKIETALHIKL